MIRLEVTEREKVGDEWQDFTSVYGVIVQGKRAESLNKLDLEGARLLVEGPLRNGKTSGYVQARTILLVGGKKKDAADTGSSKADDEIPF